MIAREHPAAVGWPHREARDLGRGLPDATATVRRTPAGLTGLAALAAVVAGAGWIAVGVAGGSRWLELPTGRHPGWILGPLHGLARGSISEPSLGVALLVLCAAYVAALACARSISPRAALAAVALANLAFVLGPTIVSSDVFGYIAYARELTAHGLNPYVFPPVALGHDAVLPFVYWIHEPSPYGPLFTLAGAPLGLLSPAAALWVFKALAGLAGLALAFMVSRIALTRGQNPARAAILVGLNPVVLFYAVSGAHNDLLAVALMTAGLGLVLGRRGRPALGAAAVVAAGAIKVTVGLALPFVIILARRRGRALGGTGLALGGTGLALVVIGVPALALFGTHLFDQVHRITTDARFDIRWSGPDVVARALGTRITPVIRVACTGAAAAVAIAALIAAWRGADPVSAAGWALLALLASVASLAPWYLIWVLPLAALGRSRVLRIAALAACGYVLAVHLPALGQHPWLSGP